MSRERSATRTGSRSDRNIDGARGRRRGYPPQGRRSEPRRRFDHRPAVDCVNFGSCSYLGLNADPRLKQGAIDAVNRFGPVFSSSTAYTSVGLYSDLEKDLELMFGASRGAADYHDARPPGSLPVLISPDDAVLVDVQCSCLGSPGHRCSAEDGEFRYGAAPQRHGRTRDSRSDKQSSSVPVVSGIWPTVSTRCTATLHRCRHADLMDRYPDLHVYLDDAHGFSWQGLHGRGFVLNEHATPSPDGDRGVAGQVLRYRRRGPAFPGSGHRPPGVAHRRTAHVFRTNPPGRTRSGVVVSADIHLSDEHADRQARLHAQIEMVKNLLIAHRLPVMSHDPTPIWFVRLGSHDQAIELTRRLMKDGFYVNPSSFPAVPRGYGRDPVHAYAPPDRRADPCARRLNGPTHLPESLMNSRSLIDLTIGNGQSPPARGSCDKLQIARPGDGLGTASVLGA